MLVPSHKRHVASSGNRLLMRSCISHPQSIELQQSELTSNIARNNTDARTVFESAEMSSLRAVRVNDRARMYFRRAAKAIEGDFLTFVNAAIPIQIIEVGVRVSSIVYTMCGTKPI
jgi:hypothetical protein